MKQRKIEKPNVKIFSVLTNRVILRVESMTFLAWGFVVFKKFIVFSLQNYPLLI